jgi:hypothetical protein
VVLPWSTWAMMATLRRFMSFKSRGEKTKRGPQGPASL